ncbi:MAG TPA: hypothetical protein VGS57_12850 [Thermoanaerobaculia bacterium]|jgi:hypothetical protein|nr:hypothetical protein [Thermoanaerobaculia bacterium]
MADPRLPRDLRASRTPRALLLPLLLLQLLAVCTLIAGRDTLILRDVLATHLPMKQAEAMALRHGELPELDVHRGGGQPLLGNPNGAPFYPTNALYLVASPLWALNAHFWIHFLIAPWSFAWLMRRLGCARAAAWVGGAVYATSGWFLSQMSFYDLVPAAALAPAFLAACLAARDARGDASLRGRGWRAAAAAGALWSLLLLGGDPAVAALALVAAVLAFALVRGTGKSSTRDEAPTAVAGEVASAADSNAGDSAVAAEPSLSPPPPQSLIAARWLPLALALLCGTAIALPQLVELLRILPTSMRGVRGYDAVASTVASWDPRQALEQLLPLPFGRVDRSGPGGFWGQRFHTGMLPLFITLYPGLLPLLLAAAAGRGRARGGRFAWSALLIGVFVALGRFNPAVQALAALPGGGIVRFPIKAWLLVAIGVSALAAIGWQRVVVDGEAAPLRRLRIAVLASGGLLLAGAVAAWSATRPLQAWMARAAPHGAPPGLVAGEAHRWALTAASLAALTAVLGWLLETRAAAAALALHAGVQLLLLAPATMALDRAAPYERTPAFASALPLGTRVAHGGVSRLFGPLPRRAAPHGQGRWLSRQGAASGMPLAGVPLGWRYELSASPEGLDSFLTRLGIEAIKRLDDSGRVRLLRAWGVEALLLERPLAAGAGAVRLLATTPGPLAFTYLYRIDGATPEVRRVSGVRVAAEPRAAIAALLDPRFDPRAEVVLPAGHMPASPGAGVARLLRDEEETLEIASDGDRPGWVVVQRAWQPHWRAIVDGRDTRVSPADLHRFAVAVPAGPHRVRLWVDRRPLRQSALGALAGLLGLIALALRGSRRASETP